MIFQIGDLVLGGPAHSGVFSDGTLLETVDPGPKNAVWHRVNVVEVKPIPGKGKKFKTVRTSDKGPNGALWECDLTVRSVTDDRYQELKAASEDGGPFEVKCNHGMLSMYIIDCSITHDENDKEKPLKETATGQYLNVATWALKLLEAND